MDSVKIKTLSPTFNVYNAFVDKFLKNANGSFVKVYLYILRFSTVSDCLSLDKIAQACDLLKSDVIAAFKYWSNQKVLSYENGEICIYPLSDDTEFSKNEVSGASTVTADVSDAKSNESTAKIYQPVSVASNYKASEVIKTVNSNESLAHLFAIISQLLNKSLSPNDYKTIYSFIDYLELPEQVIIILFEYCASIQKTAMRYVEKIAISWSDNGINTPELALEHVKHLTGEKNILTEYRKKFKISGRDFSETEEQMLLSWINECKADDELIMKAYDITVLNTGKVLFKYMDAIIRDEVSHKEVSKSGQLSSNVRKSTFRNYPKDDSIGEIEKKMIEKMMSQYGGDSDADNK